MKDFDIFENGLHIKFRITEEGRALLLNCSNKSYNESAIKTRNLGLTLEPETAKQNEINNINVFSPVEIVLSNGQFNDHHGAKKSKSDCAARLKFVELEDLREEEGRHLILILKNDEVEVRCHYKMYDNIPVIRSFTEVTALKDIKIEYLSSFQCMGIGVEHGRDVYEKLKIGIPHNAWHGEAQWRFSTLSDHGLTACHDSFYMKKLSYGNTGSWSSKEYLPNGILYDDKSLIFWQIEHNGSWYSEIGNLRGFLYLSLYGPTFLEGHWEKALKTGQSFVSVPVALCFTDNLNLAIEAMTIYRRQIVVKHKADKNLPTQYNDYMHANWANPHTERLLKQIDAAAKYNLDYFVIDAGWYSDDDWWDTIGEWKEAPNRFKPFSLKYIFDYIRSKGMKGGLWLEIESVGVNCPILSKIQHLCMKRDNQLVKDHDRYFLDFSLKETQEYGTSIINRLVDEYGINYIKMDYNVDCLAGCNNNFESLGNGLLMHNRCYLQWIDDIQKLHKDLIIEACASGGMRLDYGTLSKHAIGNTSDQIYYNRIPYIVSNLSASMLPEQTGVWCYPRAEDNEEQVIMNMVNSMLFRIQLSGQIESLSERLQQIIKEGLKIYNSLKDFKKQAVPYLPLGMCRFFDETVAFGLRKDNKLILCVYNLKGNRKKIIPISNLKPSKAKIIFPINCMDNAKIENKNLHIHFNQDESARLLEITLEN